MERNLLPFATYRVNIFVFYREFFNMSYFISFFYVFFA